MIRVLVTTAVIILSVSALERIVTASRHRQPPDLVEEREETGAALSSIVAHELATPIAALNVLTDMLAQSGLAPEEKQELTSAIKGELRLLRSLISDVRHLGSIHGGVFPVELREVLLGEILQRAATFATTLDPEAEITLSAPADCWVVADPQRIDQVLHNLVSNAIRYSQPGTPLILCAHKHAEIVEISVIDRGPGIPSDLLPFIFQMRVHGRGPDRSPHPSQGLGLYVCRRIVEDHGGYLVVNCPPEGGTAFTFGLRSADDPATHH